jgi:hypothetical protein
MASKKYFFSYGTFSIKDVSKIMFWEDRWLGDASLREQYPVISPFFGNRVNEVDQVQNTY